MTLQELLTSLQSYWGDAGCLLSTPYDVETGAGTMNPNTFLSVLEHDKWNVAYPEPSRRPVDGRYGENPFRVYKHMQFQVVMKPSPDDIIDRYVASLGAMGIDVREHDLRFEEDNWEAPTLGAWGLGWQVLLDGMEITQFTYFQQVGGITLDPIAVEITYGLERLSMFLGSLDNIFDVAWNKDVSYRDVRQKDEYEFSKYSFELADIKRHFRWFDDFEAEAQMCIDAGLPRAGYDFVLKCSHVFNVLDARGAISVTERARYMGRVRTLACKIADMVHAGGRHD